MNSEDHTIKYVVISPVRDEELNIEKTILSMVSQSIKPVEWIIVDDGSTDNTGSIIDAYAAQYHWIKALHRNDRGFRQAGGGVIDAFYDGYNRLRSKEWAYIVKLDGDLKFDGDYFENCFKYFDEDQNLGISGGGIYHLLHDKMILEENPVFHVRGATKIYRQACWNDIGGLFRVPGWDTLDEIKANLCGWKTKGFVEMKLLHLRYTGEAEGSWRNLVKNGLANYIAGYHPLFMFFKCMKRSVQKPYGIQAIGLMYGFMKGYFKKIPQVDDRELVCYLRKEQINSLLLRPSIWTKNK